MPLARVLRDALLGLTYRAPASDSRRYRVGLVLWRVVVVLAPLCAWIAAGAAAAAATDARDQANAILDDPLIMMFSLGLALLPAAMLLVVAEVYALVAVALAVFALPLFGILNHRLAQELRGGPGTVHAAFELVVVGVLLLLLAGWMPASVAFVAAWLHRRPSAADAADATRRAGVVVPAPVAYACPACGRSFALRRSPPAGTRCPECRAARRAISRA